jgi:IS30 family transposase
MQSYQHFTLTERIKLSEKLKEGKGFGEITREMGRHKSSISREYHRNKNKDGKYHPWRATVMYILRRKRSVRKSRLEDEEVRKFIISGLEQFWSPEIISERWKKKYPEKTLAYATIYRGIKKKRLPGISAKTHLRRRGKRKNSHNTQTIHPVHTIHDRPLEAETRKRLGDLEGDTVYGGIAKGCLVTLVDRTSRFLYAALSSNRQKELIADAFSQALGDYKPKTITLDNGSEFADFLKIEKNLQTTIYFADPHSPWQRGSNENINGLIRFFFPKGTNFHAVTQDQLDSVVSLINNRPRKCLGWLSPLEFLFAKCCT